MNEINDANFEKILEVQHGEFLAKGGLEAGINSSHKYNAFYLCKTERTN